MTTALTTAHALENLEQRGPLAAPVAVALDAPMQTWSKVLYAEPDNSQVSGYWRCEPGRSRWEFTDRSEVILILDGVMHVEQDGGAAVRLGAGESAAFPRGWKGIWTIEQTLSKFFVITR